MPMFIVEGGMGRLAAHADSARAASAAARKRYGTVHAPFTAHVASTDDLAEHLRGGAVLFNADGSIMDPAEAYPLAGLPVPAKFARAN